jgi:hypothetical protein
MGCPRRLDWIVFVGLALAALGGLPACGSRGLNLDQVVVADNSLPPTASQGTLAVVFAPVDETPAEMLSDPGPAISIRADGKDVVDSDGEVLTVGPGSWIIAGNYEGGIHNFAVVAAGGGTLFAGDSTITSGEATRLYLFGSFDALEGRFASYPFVPEEGSMHVGAINLVADGGVEIEVVSCADVTACTPVYNVANNGGIADETPPFCPNTTNCAPVSPHLALGDTFDADFPLGGIFGLSQTSATSVSFGYRQVATPSLSVPPIQSMVQADPIPLTLRSTPANYLAAPEDMDNGTCTLSAY